MDSASHENKGLDKARPFFERAEEVATTDNFDYAIDLYLEGLRRSPDAVEIGHKPLRHLSMIRQAKGGKKPSILEKMKHSRGKDPVEKMLNAVFLLAKEPDNISYAEAMFKAAGDAGLRDVISWIGNLLFQANAEADKPSLDIFLLMRDVYIKAEMPERAVAACQWAARLKPDDAALKDQLRDLSADLAMLKGRYGEGKDFKQSLKDRDSQVAFQDQERAVKTSDYRIKAVDEARRALAEKPESPTNLMRLADALVDMADQKNEDAAVELMMSAWQRSGSFVFRRHAGELNIRVLRRRMADAKRRLEADAGNAELRVRLEHATQTLSQTELEHYKACVEQYPTDASLKYQLGLAYLKNSMFDEAIPMFQEARRDPRTNITALSRIGICFFMKGWLTDAADVFREAIEAYEIKDDAAAKELQYNLGRTYEQQGDKSAAVEIYRKLAQIDYGYKDVRVRLDHLRNGGSNGAEKG